MLTDVHRLGTAYHYFGEISITSTGATMPCRFGCVVAFFAPLPVTVAISLLWPKEFDSTVFAEQINRVRSEHGTTVLDEEEREAWFSPRE